VPANLAFSVGDERRCRAGTGAVRCEAPTSDRGLELTPSAPSSLTSRAQRSPIELLSPPLIAGRAPPPPPPARKSDIGGSGVEREYNGKGASTPSLFSNVVAGAAGAVTVPLHTPFFSCGLLSESFCREPKGGV
jgi:hypothetical protein